MRGGRRWQHEPVDDYAAAVRALKARGITRAELGWQARDDDSEKGSDGDGSDAESSADNAGESGSTNTPGGSVMQDKMAAASTAQL